MNKIGFTGTRWGMSKRQLSSVEDILDDMLRAAGHLELRHGMCMGADHQFHQIARRIDVRRKITIIGLPGTIDKYRASCDCDEIRSPMWPTNRNVIIVNESEFLLATPGQPEEQRRSGTWSTIRYAKKIGKSHRIIKPEAL